MLLHASIILKATMPGPGGIITTLLMRRVDRTSGGQSMEHLWIDRVGDFGMEVGITPASARLTTCPHIPRAVEGPDRKGLDLK